MGNQDKKFTWLIKNLSFSQYPYMCSDKFVIGGCKWVLMAFPNRDKNESCLSLYLWVSGYKSLPCGWRRHTKFSISIVNQISKKLSIRKKNTKWVDQKFPFFGFIAMIPLTKLHDKDGGFLVNGEVKIVAEVEVLEVVGKLDVSEEPKDATQPKREDGMESKDLLKETSSVKESIDVNGFQVLPSQVELLKRIFERHPDIALEFRAKNQHLRTTCINFLLSIIGTLCQSLQDLSNEDLVEANIALTYLKDAGFKVDWLEKKLENVKEKKKEEQIGETRMQELEEVVKSFKQDCSDKEARLEKEKVELKVMKQKCSDIEALLEKQKGKRLAAIATPLTLSDVV